MDVELVGHDAGFLQKAYFVDFGILHERVDAFAEFRFPRLDALRIEDLDLVDDFVQVDYAAGEVYGEVCTFLFSHGNDAVQSLVKFRLQVLFPNFVVTVAVGELQNFRDGKNVFELDIACNAVLFLHRFRDFYKFFDGGIVVANGNVSRIARAESDGKVHGTANKLVLNLCLEVIFEIGKIFGNLA